MNSKAQNMDRKRKAAADEGTLKTQRPLPRQHRDRERRALESVEVGTIQQSPLPSLEQPWVQEFLAAIEEVYAICQTLDLMTMHKRHKGSCSISTGTDREGLWRVRRTKQEGCNSVNKLNGQRELHFLTQYSKVHCHYWGMQPWVQESPAAIEEVYHVAMCVWMWPRPCACVCEYLLALTMPCI